MRETTAQIAERQERAYEKAISFGELYKALKKSCRNVRWKDSVSGYEINGLKNTYKLMESLQNGKYKIDTYYRFVLKEPKVRNIVATRLKDRQFQRSLCDHVLYPEITKSFIRDNVACQEGKGVEDAHRRMKAHLRRHYNKYGPDGWVLACDIHHFFDETPHSVSKAALAGRIKSPRALEKCEQIIDSFGGDKGTGLGSQVSQLTQLLVLSDVDHVIKDKMRIKRYMRYNDDFCAISDDKRELINALDEIRRMAAEKGLSLNKKTRIYPLKEGVKWLKWDFRLTNSGKVVMTPVRGKESEERRKLRKLKGRLGIGKTTMDDVRKHYQGFIANMERGNTRAIILKMNRYYKEVFGEEYPYVEKRKRKRKGAKGRGPGAKRAEGNQRSSPGSSD